MGANAQTAVPTFTAGQVLTAAQQNQSARTGVPVFASTVTRDAAFGGTGEKTLAEGQLCYVEGTGLQTYNGTAWVTWGAAPSSGLTLISTTTIGSAVSSVTVSNVFSSTYDNYEIIVSGGVASTDNSLLMQLGSATTGYYWGGFFTGTSWTAALNAERYENGSAAGLFFGTTNSLSGNARINNPNLAKVTTFYTNGTIPNTTGYGIWRAGWQNSTTQFTGFTLTTSSGTVTGGTVKVYGYQNS